LEEKRTWIGALLSQRQVIPRWHSPQSALHAGERDSVKLTLKPHSLPKKWVPILSEQAVRNNADPHAQVELEEMRFLSGEKSSIGLLDTPQLKRAQQLWQLAAGNAGTRPPERPDINGDWYSQEKNNVAKLRQALKAYPNQALLWSELARAHIVLGDDKKATRAMSCAIQLAGKSAYLRRSAARMYLHLEEPLLALKVVREHPNFRNDPRMLSAEIAISSRTNQPLRYAKQGLALLESPNTRPTYLSELAAALGTVELEHGKHKRSRILFARSMISPSENALAQIQWATERDSQISIPTEAWLVPRSYEAHALAARLKNDWDSVLDATERWLNEEPFATRPAMLGSFASFSVDQNHRAEKLVSQALQSNPNSSSLHNNRAVARAYIGDLDGALLDAQSAIDCEADQMPYSVATVGLIAYRLGDYELGAKAYGAALAKFVKLKNAPSTLLASLYWLRELARIGDLTVEENLIFIKKNLSRFAGVRPEPEIQSMLELVEADVAQKDLAMRPKDEIVAYDLRKLFDRLSRDLSSAGSPAPFLDRFK
jgi:tetratricopeptide (TPR) repeat protein